MSNFIDKIVSNCTGERDFFRDGKRKEYEKSVYLRIGDYWDELAKVPEYVKWKGYNGRTDCKLKLNSEGEVIEVLDNQNQPWSAAFISYILAVSGAGSKFSYSPSHSIYIVKALKEAAKTDSKAPFIARRHKSYAPKIGDLIACERRKTDDANFDTYIDYVKAGRYEAHCDFVVEINGNQLTTIGGNVSNSVTSKVWPLNAQGRIGDRDPNSSTAGVICIIETRL